MKFKSLLSIALMAAGFIQPALAANLTNKIQGVGPASAPVSPNVCIQDGNGQMTYALLPGATVDANKYSGNDYYVGATLRFGGCDTSNTYLGYLGLGLNNQHSNKVQQYTPPLGVHIAYKDYALDSSGNLTGKIEYTAITPNFNLLTSAPSQNANWDFVGINLSGLEFSKMIDPVVVPNISEEDASGTYTDLADTQAFIKAGMNTIRVPVSWGYLQVDGPGKGDIYLAYYNSYVKPLLESLTSAKVYAILDMHDYMRYSEFGKQYSGCNVDGPCPDGTLITDVNAYKDLWTKLYTLIKNDPKIDQNYLMFDLNNEPVDVPNDSVFTIQAELIKMLRQQGFAGYILIEGNSWTGLHSWSTASWTSTDGKTTYTNASLFTRENFNKAGITDLTKIIINVHQYLDSNYSGTHDQCVTDLSTTGPDGYNLDAFTEYLKQNHLKAIITEFGGGRDSSSCSVAINNFMNYLKENSAKGKDYGFVGWTIWSAGHGWGDYNLRVTPTSYQMQVLYSYLK